MHILSASSNNHMLKEFTPPVLRILSDTNSYEQNKQQQKYYVYTDRCGRTNFNLLDLLLCASDFNVNNILSNNSTVIQLDQLESISNILL